MGTILLLLFLLFLGWFVWTVYQGINSLEPQNHISNWSCYFADIQFSAQDFYDAVEKKLVERQIPDIKILKVEFSERGSLLDNYRTYLRVRDRRYLFDIGAAPYGTGSFVSWHLGEDINIITVILSYVPILGSYIKNRLLVKTYYSLDRQGMFQQAIQHAISEVMETLGGDKAMRALSDTQRQPKSSRNPA